MSYFELIGLEKEPFSTSPDPDFFYKSTAHKAALSRLEIAIRLRRGLSLIMGDIGTGKTTLARALLQSFAEEEDFIFHMILDPTYKSEFQFLSSLMRMFGIEEASRSTLDLRESIEKYLFKKGVEDNKTIILIIDEGQKLSPEFLEILRILLNFETNEFKLLQLIIMSQMEIWPKIRPIRNFIDRIALKYVLNPLDENETQEMINFRLSQAGLSLDRKLFTEGAIKLIYNQTQGYPRKISYFCHSALEKLVMNNLPIADEAVIYGLIQEEANHVREKSVA